MSRLPAIVDAARALAAAGRGERTRIVADLAATLGVSVQTAYRQLREHQLADTGRRRRADAGQTELLESEAILIAALIEASRRQTGTGALTLEDAVRILREDGRILAGSVDEGTGEMRPLSLSAISRAMRHYHCHPGQLAAETPATSLSSPHPNWCWQIDASLSAQFYLADAGTQQLDKTLHYEGKPQHLAKIADRRLWRYAITDHCSGAIALWYCLGAESAANAISALIFAMTQRPDSVMYGVPRYVMSDGGVLGSTAMQTFLRALGINPIKNATGKARVKGQVEGAHNIIERSFEAPLKLRSPVKTLEEINRHAVRWATWYAATQEHGRHGMTRRDAWLRITSEQLTLAPPVAVLQQLPQSVPKACTVRDHTINFRGKKYDLRGLPTLVQGAKVDVVINPFDLDGSVRVLIDGEDGKPSHYIAPLIQHDEWGFRSDAAQIGTEYKAAPETPVDAARKEIERLAMEVDTDAAAKAARKAKRVPFGGSIDPTQSWTAPVVALPRAGQASDVVAPTVVEPTPVVPTERRRYVAQRLSQLDTIRELRRLVIERGAQWTPELYAQAQQRWPEGLTEDELPPAVLQLLRPVLRAVGGGL
jgi:hypothetical protein